MDGMSDRLVRSTVAALDLYTVYIGERLGFYRTLAEVGPTTSTELAHRTGTHERLVREWLEQQAATGLLTVDDPAAEALERRYAIRDEDVPALADADHVSFTAHEGVEMARVARSLPDVVDTFRTGNAPPPLGWEPEGRAEWNRAKYLARLGREWLPAIEPIDRRLRAEPPAKVADFACGTGWSSIAMAEAYPSIVVHGRDLDADAVAAARENVAAHGLGDRVSIAVADASQAADSSYDLVTILEALHDMTRPVEVLRAAREMLAPGGSVLVADERVSDTFMTSASVRDRYVHGISVVSCLPEAMGDPDSAMTGAVMRVDTLRRYATDAGFGTIEILPIEDHDLRLYRLVP